MSDTMVRFATTGMHCSSCSMLIDMTLADLPGVVSSRTDHADGTSVVTFDDSATNVDAIVAAVRGVGYDAEPLG